ncbi:Mismatch repair endonuclease pms2, partial [Apophysomyces ossiformis]
MTQTIRPIDKQSIHRICSGQVVLDLATAVKELVENSIDAGATSVEIKFKENGLEGLEVIDNGSGVHPTCYESIALKHYTSKLQTFEDLERVTTFGFRGEALSSLCALSDLAIITATAEQAPKGVRLEYDANGQLKSQAPVARTVGTTVQLSNIFHSLPVRQREFSRNIKREYGKALAMIQSYAIISTNVRIIATNQSTKGKTTRVLSTNGNKTIRENIANVFGAKFCTQMVAFTIDLSPVLGASDSSKPSHNGDVAGVLPTASIFILMDDRVPFRGNFISNQYPFVVADIKVPTEQLEPSRSTFGINALMAENLPAEELSMASTATMESQSIPALHQEAMLVDSDDDDDATGESQESRKAFLHAVSREAAQPSTSLTRYALTSPSRSPGIPSTGKRPNSTLDTFIQKRAKTYQSPVDRDTVSDEEVAEDETTKKMSTIRSPRDISEPDTETLRSIQQNVETDIRMIHAAQQLTTELTEMDGVDEIKQPALEPEMLSYRNLWNTIGKADTVGIPSMDQLKYGVQLPELRKPEETTEEELLPVLKNANISNVENNEDAADALSRIIKKSDFAEMRILGQFNLGFIIAVLDDHDLFIIDQHASDEKYNFETLQQTTRIEGQRLIRPHVPELTAAEELVVMENVEILRANGFDVRIDPEAEPTRRVQVVSQPASKNTMFDSRDFSELVFLLSERPGEMVRCSKNRAMFASRACRRSVMIGDSLNIQKMTKIVRHMGEIDQPW